MNLQGRRIDPHRICRRALAGQRREDPVEGADRALADDAVPARLRRPADGRPVAPRQPAPDARNDPEDHPPVLPPRHAARRVRQRRLQAGEPDFGNGCATPVVRRGLKRSRHGLGGLREARPAAPRPRFSPRSASGCLRGQERNRWFGSRGWDTLAKGRLMAEAWTVSGSRSMQCRTGSRPGEPCEPAA